MEYESLAPVEAANLLDQRLRQVWGSLFERSCGPGSPTLAWDEPIAYGRRDAFLPPLLLI